MKKKAETKGKIVAAAWELFYEQGYEDTTVEEIIVRSGTSKGSFYHYFEGKDALLSSLSYLFDEKYEELMDRIDPEINAFSLLLDLNRELFFMIETRIPVDLLARLYASQLVAPGDKSFLDRGRLYYKLLRKVIMDGQRKGELTADLSVSEMVKRYALCERALLYDWCLCGGEYSLTGYSSQMLPSFLHDLKKN